MLEWIPNPVKVVPQAPAWFQACFYIWILVSAGLVVGLFYFAAATKSDAATPDSTAKADQSLKWIPPSELARVSERLEALDQQLLADVAQRQDDNILLATWNVRYLGRQDSRLAESIHYIARIISAFDIVAIQEVQQDTTDLERLSTLLGDDWRLILGEVSQGTVGNHERTAFFYYEPRVISTGHSGSVVLPPQALVLGEHQFARVPHIASFETRSGFRLTLCNARLYYGGTRDVPRRVAEAEALAKYLNNRAASRSAEVENLVVLGDLQVRRLGDPVYRAFADNGFAHPSELEVPTMVLGEFYYARMFFQFRRDRFRLAFGSRKAGALDWSKSVFRDADVGTYSRLWFGAGDPSDAREYRIKTTLQISDHLPLWVALGTH
ncbi:MAG: endonuclease/exonuclease/phosphatase family protein [Planctomycetota bacterium]|jgi:endonuclease/exonuclease/phosphatase family metal-dependent hydrolase